STVSVHVPRGGTIAGAVQVSAAAAGLLNWPAHAPPPSLQAKVSESPSASTAVSDSVVDAPASMRPGLAVSAWICGAVFRPTVTATCPGLLRTLTLIARLAETPPPAGSETATLIPYTPSVLGAVQVVVGAVGLPKAPPLAVQATLRALPASVSDALTARDTVS